jgi:hypothetical protein
MSNKFKEEERWTPPQPEEVAFVVDKIGGVSAAARIIKKRRDTVYKWISGTTTIDYANWTMINGK